MDLVHASMDLELVKNYLISRLLALKQTSIISDALEWVLYRTNVFLDAQKKRLWYALPSDDRDGLEFVLGVLEKALCVHGILKLRQCMQHFEFWLRVRCWSNKSFLIFHFILSCRFFRLHCKHQIFNILQYFKYISDYFWLGVCILNGNERINWRKYIYSQYNPYKKVSLYRKTSAVFIFYD